MKRYSLIMDPETAEYDLIPTATYGDWVRFEDHAAEVHELNNRLTATLLEIATLKTPDLRERLGRAMVESQKLREALSAMRMGRDSAIQDARDHYAKFLQARDALQEAQQRIGALLRHVDPQGD